jgi:hypothetical protein
MCLSMGCAEIVDLRDDPTLLEDGGEPQDPPAPGSPYAGCEGDDKCEGGTFCDRDWKTCKPLCTDDVGCSGGRCLYATDGGEDLDFKTCAAMCNPVAATKCGLGAACFLLGTALDPIWDCGSSLGWKLGETACSAAQGDRPCANGLVCIDDRCQKYCFASDPEPIECATTGCVALLDSNEVFDGKPLGSCY